MKRDIKHDQAGRMDRQLAAAHDDPYRPKKKLAEPTVCPQCELVFSGGRWQQSEKPAQADEHLCPACRRTNDRFPAGFVTLRGDYVHSHHDELLQLAYATEVQERREHPLHRIMEVVADSERIALTTTDIHVARHIGDALHRAYKGDLDIKYGPEDHVVRVTWER